MQRRLPQLRRLGVLAALLGACAGPAQGTIGAIMAQDKKDGRVQVREVPPDLGAAKAGLEAGDEILSVDGRDVRHMTPTDLREALGGDVGATVRLTIFRQGRILRLVITRTPAQKAP